MVSRPRKQKQRFMKPIGVQTSHGNPKIKAVTTRTGTKFRERQKTKIVAKSREIRCASNENTEGYGTEHILQEELCSSGWTNKTKKGVGWQKICIQEGMKGWGGV